MFMKEKKCVCWGVRDSECLSKKEREIECVCCYTFQKSNNNISYMCVSEYASQAS